MHDELLKRDIIHAEETPIQVLKEKDRPPQSKSYMWVYRTGNDGKAPVIIFNYKPSRSGDNAVRYLRGFMEKYLLDGRCSISNNLAENAIRPFATGRKNWLFADTPKGADASSRVYSIVETAKANGLDVLKYLEELLLAMPMWDHTEGYLERMMPWSDYMQDLCKV